LATPNNLSRQAGLFTIPDGSQSIFRPIGIKIVRELFTMVFVGIIPASTGAEKMIKQTIIGVALTMALASPAFAGSCPKVSGEITAALATGKASPAVMADAKKLQAQGDEFHKAGKHAEAMEALGKSKKALGM
jgi:hypothetical protein